MTAIEILSMFEKAQLLINATCSGMLIAASAEQEQNASASIRFSSQPFSNETDASAVQPEKHSEQRISTCRGMLIRSNAKQELNTLASMRFKTLPASKEIDERDLQDKKHSDARTSTIGGSAIEVNAEE
jgi:hypothetical protein